MGIRKKHTKKTTQRICIVTSDFAGITHNGGIGTACANLSYMLAESGYDVTVLYTYDTIGDANVLEWQDKLASLGITLELLTFKENTDFGASSFHQNMSLRAYQWLNEHDSFDYIHFPDWRGTGYFTALAKHTHIAFANTNIVIQLHSPTIWHRIHNNEKMNSKDLIDTHTLEKETVALADIVISPSQYLVDWCKKREWAFPKDTHVIQNLLSPNFTLSDNHKQLAPSNIKEIVFFGRLEIRKGILLFCQALAKLDPTLIKGKKITFLGKESLIQKRPSLEILHKKLDALPITWQAKTTLNSDEAIAYLQGKNRMVVIASLVENSPYVVLESLGFGFPMIATNSGGTAELVHTKDQRNVLFAPTAQNLLKQLTHVLTHGATRAHMSSTQEQVKEAWLNIHQPIRPTPQTLPIPHTTERLGICIFFEESLAHLKKTIIALQDQPCSPLIDIIVVPTANTPEKAYKELPNLCKKLHVDLDHPRDHIPLDVLFTKEDYPFVLYMHEHCMFEHKAIDTLITHAKNQQSDILTSFINQNNNNAKYYHMPIAYDQNLLSLYNSIGCDYLIVRQSLFDKLKKVSFPLPITSCFREFLKHISTIKNITTTLLPKTYCTSSYITPSSYNAKKITKKNTQLINHRLLTTHNDKKH